MAEEDLPTRQTNMKFRFKNKIELNDISFSYPDMHAPAIKNISLTISKGQSIAFVGTTGSGKSTLLDTLLGLLSPQSGKIQIDGINIKKDLSNWRCQFGYVPQTIYLNDASIRSNIAFGIPKKLINEKSVQRALKAAQLDKWVLSLPDGLDTIVGERGVRISGGQRQRVGIARALYHDPAILVLDEATSALDVATEEEVMRSVLELKGDITIIIVAHRLSTVEKCDCLYKLEQGIIIEEIHNQ